MEEMRKEHFDIESEIKKYSIQLSDLLSAKSVKYSEWPNIDKTTLSKSAGIYHFFECDDENLTSLYVGKAGFGSSRWSLSKRLHQHFQVSQKNALLGKIAKISNQEPEKIKDSLCNREVFLQWLILCEADLVWTECFCKSILMPKYTDA
jgi:hypothetical protein